MRARVRVGPVAVVIAALALLPFWSVLPASFVSDDFNFVGPYLHSDRAPLSFIWDAFTGMRDVPAAFYRPLPFVSLWLEFRAWGDWPPGFHLVNLLLHAGVVALVYAVGRRLTGQPDVGMAAAVAALWFALHPRRVEPVSWLSCRPDLLAGFLALCSFWAFLRWRETREQEPSQAPPPGTDAVVGPRPAGVSSTSWLIVALASWWAAIASKEQALLLPLAYLFVPARGWPLRSRALALLPFVASWPIYFALRRLALGEWIGGYGSGSYTLQTVASPGMWLRYVAYGVLPPLEFVASPGGYRLAALMALAAAAGVAAIVWRARRERGLPAAIVWTLAAVLPVVPFQVSLTTSFNDRLLYAPAAGLALMVAVSLATVTSRIPVLLGLVAALALVPQTVSLAGRWRVAGDLTERLAHDIARELNRSGSERPMVLAAVPDSYGGAYMLRNGVRDAVRLAGGTSADRLVVLTQYLADDPERAPVDVTVTPSTVEVRSVGPAAVLLPAVVPRSLIQDDATSRLDGSGTDRLGRRIGARFHLETGSDVWVVHPTRLEPVRPVPAP